MKSEMNNAEIIKELRTSPLFDNSTLGNRAADALEAALKQVAHWKEARASSLYAGEQMKVMLEAEQQFDNYAKFLQSTAMDNDDFFVGYRAGYKAGFLKAKTSYIQAASQPMPCTG